MVRKALCSCSFAGSAACAAASAAVTAGGSRLESAGAAGPVGVILRTPLRAPEPFALGAAADLACKENYNYHHN